MSLMVPGGRKAWCLGHSQSSQQRTGRHSSPQLCATKVMGGLGSAPPAVQPTTRFPFTPLVQPEELRWCFPKPWRCVLFLSPPWSNNKRAFSTGAQDIDKGRGGDSTDLRQPIRTSGWETAANQDSGKAWTYGAFRSLVRLLSMCGSRC